ncbi:MAG: photosystem II complex extrinsic protein PsbU [Cyanobacteria bacterium J06598_1]
MKQALGSLVAIGIAVVLFSGSVLFGAATPASALPFDGTAFDGTAFDGTEAAFSRMTLVANAAGGEELRNSVDDKLATAYGNKIDVNNTNIASFRKFRGLYPTIAGKVVTNAPYDSVEDILEIPGLKSVERDRLQKNMDIFTISAPDPALVEGADRFNNGVYK